MLEEVRLRNVGVIEDAALTLGPGLSVLTGETGAGKTMVLTGLGLLMGQRPEPHLVRHGADQGEVNGVLTAEDDALAEWAERGGWALDDGALLISRVIPARGRARAFLGGRAVPAAVLAELAERYITVHGQAGQQRLRSPAHQRAALDEFAGLGPLLVRYRSDFDEIRRLDEQLRDWEEASRQRANERTHLTEGLAAIDRLNPQPGEDDDLRLQAERLTNIEELRAAVEGAYSALTGDSEPGLVDRLEAVRHQVQSASRYDAELSEWAEILGQANQLLAQVATDVGIHRATLEADPQLLEDIHARRAALTDLMRRYGPTLADVLEWAFAARTRLAALEAESQGDLHLRMQEARERANALASDITARRRAAAHELEDRVTAELAGLGLKDAHLEIRVDAATPGPFGHDEVTMLLAAHRNAPALPVAASASGGELSRIMLALEVSLATRPEDHTFVFDEVDAGIGGNAAVEVGRRLKDLSRHHQVIVVTHLPQVAAFADHHLVVTKTATDGVPSTRVVRVTGPQREEEIARMLAGDTSATALRHAAELLQRLGVGS